MGPLEYTDGGITSYPSVAPSDATASNSSIEEEGKQPELRITYVACEVSVGILAAVGNALVVFVFCRQRHLRRLTNYYIVALAVADFLVGVLGIPFAILASIGLPRHLRVCLFTTSVLLMLCTISIFCLVAVSVDRYWAILHPLAYSRNMTTNIATGVIIFCWVLGALIGLLPLLGWNSGADRGCEFVKVMNYDYLVFLYFATIIGPAVLMMYFYAHIYRVVLRQRRPLQPLSPKGRTSLRKFIQTDSTRQLRQIASQEAGHRSNSSSRRSSITGFNSTASGSGGMLRLLGAANKREVKAAQNLAIIVLFFMMCWIPLYTINCFNYFCRDCVVPMHLMDFTIILSHTNSAVNPLLYAYHLKDFRAALKSLFCPAAAAAEAAALASKRYSFISCYNTTASHAGSMRYHSSNCRQMPRDVVYCGRNSSVSDAHHWKRGSQQMHLRSIHDGSAFVSHRMRTNFVNRTALAPTGTFGNNALSSSAPSGIVPEFSSSSDEMKSGSYNNGGATMRNRSVSAEPGSTPQSYDNSSDENHLNIPDKIRQLGDCLWKLPVTATSSPSDSFTDGATSGARTSDQDAQSGSDNQEPDTSPLPPENDKSTASPSVTIDIDTSKETVL